MCIKMDFIINNIAYILVAAAVLYFIFFAFGIINAKKTGEPYRFKYKSFIGFLLILGFAVYCLATGQDIRQFIH